MPELKLDLHCNKCFNEIKKVFDSNQYIGISIESILYEEDKKSITICGPFDANSLCMKLRCMAPHNSITIESMEITKTTTTVDQTVTKICETTETVVRFDPRRGAPSAAWHVGAAVGRYRPYCRPHCYTDQRYGCYRK